MPLWSPPVVELAAGQVSTFEDLLNRPLKLDSDFERLIQRDYRPESDFERLLKQDHVPTFRRAKPVAPPYRPRAGFRRAMGGTGDEILSLAIAGAELLAFLAEKEEEAAAKQGMTAQEARGLKEDIGIVKELEALAQLAITKAISELERARKKKRTTVKRVRIHAWGRR